MALKTGIQIIIEIMQNEGIEYVFGLPGATEVVFLDALEKQDKIKYILCLQETVAMGAAEGYARTSGKAGFVNLHTYAGLASSLGMLVNARNGGVPLVITAGQQDSRLLMQEPHLAGPLPETVSRLTKWSTEVRYVEEIPIAMQRAFKVALQPPTGPVFISLPQNVLTASMEYQYTPDTPLFSRLRADEDALYQAMDLMINAKNPAILVEDGVDKYKALHEVVKLAELMGTPVYQTWMGDVNCPSQHPQYMGELGTPSPQFREALKDVDVLTVIGCQLFSYQVHDSEPLLNPNTRIIQIDDNPWEIGKNFPVAVGIQGNIKEAVIELTRLLSKKILPHERTSALKRIKEMTGRKEARMAALMQQAQAESNQVPIAVSRFTLELKNAMPAGTMIVDDCWSSSALIRQLLDLKETGDFQRSRHGGSIGWGMPGAIGVKLAAPNRPVVALCGDGSAIWSIQSLWTAAHYHLPITYIVLANRSYHIAKIKWVEVLRGATGDRHQSLELDNPVIDFCQIAQALGVHAQKAEKPEELGKILKAALGSGKPELIEVHIKPFP